MKYSVIVLLLLAACGESAPEVSSVAASSPAQPTALNQRSDVDISGFIAAYKVGESQLVDVRTVEEFKGGHVPGAVNVPLDQVHPDNDAIKALAKEKPLYVICALGGRSSRAADTLAAAGFQTINVKGGTSAWKAREKPLEH